MVRTPLYIARYAFNSVFDPEKIVASRSEVYDRTLRSRIRTATWLVVFFLANLLLYAVPLTYAGFGTARSPGEPISIVTVLAETIGTDPVATWQYVFALAQNCLFLFLFSALTFGTFHVCVWLTRNSNGVLQSIHTVVYSTGIYLATIFTLTWYLSTSSTVTVADEWLLWVQTEFIYTIIDVTGFQLDLAAGRMDPVALDDLTRSGTIGLTALGLTVGYYLYSLYLGARINHDSSRFSALLVIGFVVASPVLFVLGSIVTTVYVDGIALALTTPLEGIQP